MGSIGIEKMHVLAVDDSLIDRKVIERLLRISSCKVTVVESGIRALEFLGLDGDETKKMASLDFQEMKVNMIMTDYSMPGMTGYELLKKIKESSACREIPVVIMSSENIMTRINRCLEEGAKDFLMKPVKLSDVERLRDVLMKGEDNSQVCEMELEASPQASPNAVEPKLTLPALSSTPVAAAATIPSSLNGPPSAALLMPTQPPLFASSDLSCSLQHLSSPPSSPHWQAKQPRLLNGDQ